MTIAIVDMLDEREAGFPHLRFSSKTDSLITGLSEREGLLNKG